MTDQIYYLQAQREYDLERQKYEYERELQEELEADWAEDRLRITYEHILEALGLSRSATITFTDDQLDDGITQEELEQILTSLGIQLTRRERDKLTDTVLTDFYYKRY